MNRSTPVQVGALGPGAGVVSIAPGDSHTCAVFNDGRPICWGGDNNGQVGVGTQIMSLGPVDVVEVPGPTLTLNYPSGKPGSFFTASGSNFSTSDLTSQPETALPVFINGTQVNGNLTLNLDGSITFLIDTSTIGSGSYFVTIGSPTLASTYFFLFSAAPLRQQDGTCQIVSTTGVTPGSLSLIYLPKLNK